jgi:uncharacterized membrane protein
MGAMSSKLLQFFRYRGRTLFAAAIGVGSGILAAQRGLANGAAALVGWNLAAALFLVPTLWTILADRETQVRRRAGREDESRAVMMILILVAVALSFIAIVVALRESRASAAHGGAQHPGWLLALCACTLVLSWAIVQSLFTLHYAHRYFGDRDGDGTADAGIQFPGDAPTTYRDFLYVAVCIGATCQVSDFDITHRRFRDLITIHALISFLFNTMVLALGINILGNLMGQ